MAKIKTTGKEWNDFYGSDWEDGLCIDDVDITVDDVQSEPDNFPDLSVVIAEGYILNQNDFNQKPIMLSSFFKKWQSAKKSKTLLVEIDNAFVDELKAFLKNKGKVLK